MPIANGIVYTPENTGGLSIINGVPATEHNGLHLVQGSRIIESTSDWPSFPGWTEVDPGSDIVLSDETAFDSAMTITTGFQTNNANISVDLPAAWNNAYGDWNIRFEFNGYDHTASRFIGIGVGSAAKPYTGGPGSLVTDGADFALWAFHADDSGAIEGIITIEWTDVGWAQGGWNGENYPPDKTDTPAVYYCEIARESGVVYIRVYSDSSYTTQLGVDAISNAVGAGWSVDKLIVVAQLVNAAASPQDAHVKFISVTPNPWS